MGMQRPYRRNRFKHVYCHTKQYTSANMLNIHSVSGYPNWIRLPFQSIVRIKRISSEHRMFQYDNRSNSKCRIHTEQYVYV